MTYSEAIIQLASVGTDPQIMSALRAIESDFDKQKQAYDGLVLEYEKYKQDQLREMTNLQINYQQVYGELKAYETNDRRYHRQNREPTVDEFKLLQQGRLSMDDLKKKLEDI